MVTTGHDLVVRHIGRLTTWQQPVITDAALVVRGGQVAWVGADRDLTLESLGGGIAAAQVDEIDVERAAVLPGFVDCHTHLVWAGSRRHDFVGRLSGAAYTPDGISATVGATRDASTAQLTQLAQQRIDVALAAGTTTIEVKSGYGLTIDDELRLIDVATALAGPRVMATYLGAHVVPPDRDREAYVDEVVATLPRAKQHGAQWCDVFCDDGAFTVDEARRILTAAADVGLGLRIHAEQIAHTGAALLAADMHCASADHLEHVTDADAAALAAAGVVAVLVPVVSLYSRSGEWAHAQVLRDAGCELAIATDCNPGTAWCESMPYAVQLACLGMGLPVDVALRAATLGGAKALRRGDVGHLGVGARGDLVVLDADHEADLVAHLGISGIGRTIVGGKPIG